MKYLKFLTASLIAILSLTTCANVYQVQATGFKDSVNESINADKDDANVMTMGQKISYIFIGIIAMLSVIMIIYGGFKYTTSGGSPDKVSAAKSVITMAVIGLIIAIFASAIVKFVIGRFV